MLAKTVFFGALLAANVASGAATPSARAALAPEGTLSLQYRSTGARDAATAATVVTCTNLGADATVTVNFFESSGPLDCQISQVISGFNSRTLATRNTAIYNEDVTCAVAPETEQGDIEIYAEAASRLICTVQIVDPAGATPVYLERLTLFDRNGVPMAFVIFADDFESGGTGAWSAVQP